MGFEPRRCRMEGADESTEQWRPQYLGDIGPVLNTLPTAIKHPWSLVSVEVSRLSARLSNDNTSYLIDINFNTKTCLYRLCKSRLDRLLNRSRRFAQSGWAKEKDDVPSPCEIL